MSYFVEEPMTSARRRSRKQTLDKKASSMYKKRARKTTAYQGANIASEQH